MSVIPYVGGEAKAQRELELKLRELGESQAIERFLSKYGKIRTKSTYATMLALYFRWFKQEQGWKGEVLPDLLIKDNLVCIFKSEAVDVQTKRRHTDWLNLYVNGYLLKKGLSPAYRGVSASVIRQFYKSNDSPLWGDYRTASQDPLPPAKPLHVEDIRRVLLDLPVRARAPLLVSWQTGIEINRVLSKQFSPDGPAPLKVELYGRKGHKQTYWTYLGSDSVEALESLPPGGFLEYSTVRKSFKETARKLAPHLKNPELRSWHPHALRHSFSEECRHAGVNPEIREFFLGHISGVKWVYLHGDLHEEDFLREYQKVEPALSLQPNRVSVRREFEEREKSLVRRLEAAEALLSALRREFPESPKAQPQAGR